MKYYFKVGSIVVITWHPEILDIIGIEVKITSEPYYIGDIMPVAWFKDKYPSWAPYVYMLYQEITDGEHRLSYPVNWMQLRRGFELDYPLVNEKQELTK